MSYPVGYLINNVLEVTGEEVGVVKKYPGKRDRSRLKIPCRCLICGKEKLIDKYKIETLKSCGCTRHIKHPGDKSVTHGDSKTNLYKRWLGIRKRCNDLSYEDYGGRGIKICEEWDTNYLAFKEWSLANGFEKNLTIERIEVNGDYTPENCKWIPKAEQSKNTRRNRIVTIFGENMILEDAIRRYGGGVVDHSLAISRLNSGWTVEEALTTHYKHTRRIKNLIEYKGEKFYSIKEVTDKYGVVSAPAVCMRMRVYGWSLDKALTTPSRLA